jgi:hypothetical protein
MLWCCGCLDPGGYRTSNDRSLDAATLRGVFLTTIGPDGFFELVVDDDEWAVVVEVGGTVSSSPQPPLLVPLPPPPEEDVDENVRRCGLCDRMRSPQRLRRYPASLATNGEFADVVDVPPSRTRRAILVVFHPAEQPRERSPSIVDFAVNVGR